MLPWVHADRPVRAPLGVPPIGRMMLSVVCRWAGNGYLMRWPARPVALVACAGVTLRAVAIATGIELRDATIRAEGDLDFRGTLAVAKDVPVGFKHIRLSFDLESDAPEQQLASLIRLTERYCVVYQTLVKAPEIAVSHRLT